MRCMRPAGLCTIGRGLATDGAVTRSVRMTATRGRFRFADHIPQLADVGSIGSIGRLLDCEFISAVRGELVDQSLARESGHLKI